VPTRRENIKHRQESRRRNSGSDTDSELKYIYGWTSTKPHAAKRSKPQKKAGTKGMKKMERDRRREDVDRDPLGVKPRSGKPNNPVRRYREDRPRSRG
jgi:hypothetical protein